MLKAKLSNLALASAAVLVSSLAGCSASLGVSANTEQHDGQTGIVERGEDVRAIREKLDDWREMFSATGRGDAFDIDDYPQLFLPRARSDEMLTFDAYVPDWASTQIDGVDGYRTVWNRDVNASFPGWTIDKMDVLRVEVSGDLAWSALNFWGTGTRADGSRYEGSQHGTHVWHDVGEGDWRIVHEHLTQIVVQGEPNVRYDTSPPQLQPQ